MDDGLNNTLPREHPRYETIPSDAIRSSQFRPDTPTDDVAELVESIDDVGQLYPVLVVEREDGYDLLDGHRRVNATRQLAGSDATVEAKIYPDSLPPATQVRMALKLHDIDDFSSLVRYAGRIRLVVQADRDALTEREVATSVGMTTGRLKKAFLYAPIVQRVTADSSLSAYLTDSQTPVTQLREGDRRVLTLQKYWAFLNSFINTQLTDDTECRAQERSHVIRLSNLLVETVFEPLWNRPSEPPHQALIDCTRHHPFKALGQVIGEDARISDADAAPLYTDDETDINWTRLETLLERAAEVPWDDPAIRDERALKRLRREIRGHLYDG